MPLIKPIILVITISLSNGGVMTYEMSENYYSQRIQFLDDENINQDMLTFHSFGNDFLFDFILIENEIQEFKREVLPVSQNWSGEKDFQNSLKPFFINDFEGLEYTKLIQAGLIMGHFYIYIKELDQLYPHGKIRNVAPIINEGYILAFSDATGIDNSFLTRPIGVNVEWKDSFSPFISEKIEALKDR